MTSSNIKEIKVLDWDLIDAVNLCHAALAQDSPQPKSFYVNQIMGLLFGYLDKSMRIEVETYLAEKKYLPPVNIQIVK